MSVTDHIEILLLEKRICQNCNQLLSNDNLLQKHFKFKTCVTNMISLLTVSESSVKKKNSSVVQDIISVLNTDWDWIWKLCQNLKIYHMKKSISAQDIDIISHSIDELILHNFYVLKSVDKEKKFWKFYYILFNDESDAVTAAAATSQASWITISQASQLSAAFTKLSHKNWIADQFIQKQSLYNQHLFFCLSLDLISSIDNTAFLLFLILSQFYLISVSFNFFMH